MKIISKLISYTLFFVFLLLILPCSHSFAAVPEKREVTLKENGTDSDLQKLLDINKYDNHCLTIHIKNGTYQIYHELRIYSNTTILCEPKATLYNRNLYGAMLANDMAKDHGGYNTTHNIKILGGTWDSTPIKSKKKEGVEVFRFIHAQKVVVQSATIKNVPDKSHLITFAGVKDSTINGCRLYGDYGPTLKEAIHLDIVHNKTIVPSTQASCIHYDDLPCFMITIKNNVIHDFPRAIGSHSSVKGVYHNRITICSNRLYNIKEAAIKLYNYINASILDNRIKNASVGILAYTTMPKEENHYLTALNTTKKEPLPSDYAIQILRNTIMDIHVYKAGKESWYGDAIRIIGSTYRPLSKVTIKENNLSVISRYGLHLEYSKKAYLGGNIISKTGRYGILVNSCPYSKLRYNSLSMCGSSKSIYGGIGVSNSSFVLIYKNIIETKARTGIYLNASTKTCTIEKNTIKGSQPRCKISCLPSGKHKIIF